jgi:2-desacetyl-2-hydroxyethyl bacteriochlorophyllide A dehydrogenase
MLAALVTAPNRIDIATVEPPEAQGRALIAVDRVGLCGTDNSILHGKIPVAYPRVLGHEVIGRVVRAGPRGEPAEGTRVLVNPSLACGRCTQCRADLAQLCPNGALMGRDSDGGFTEQIAVDEHQLLGVSDDLPRSAAALLQVLGTCVHAQTHLDHVFPGQTAVVIGLGVSGFLMLQLMRARGLQVLGVTRSAWKRSLGEQLGAVAVVPPHDARQAVDDLTGGAGVDVSVEAVGTVETFAQAIDLAGLGGQVLLFGTIGGAPKAELPFYQLYYKELTIHNPRAARHRDYERGIALATSGALDLEALFTHSFPLERASDAFDALNNDPRALKVTLDP